MTPHGQQLLRCLASNVVHLILMPTEACNFRCVYCYEDFRLGRMSPEVVRAVKAFLTRRAAGVDDLTLSWFGGEPLLALEVIEDVLVHAQALRRRHRNIVLRSDITTNAYTLAPPVFERLLGLGVTRYQIAFDGQGDEHDRKRVRLNGGPTFDRIWRNVLAMRESSGAFSVLVRLHVDRDDAPAAEGFIDTFRAAFGGDPRFRLFLRALSRWGGPNDARLQVLEGEKRDRVLESLRAYAEQRGVAPYEPAMDSPICYASHGNSFVVRADGRLGKCTLALDHPRNQVGRLLTDGHVELDAEGMTGWMRGVFSEDEAELHCPMRGYADAEPAAAQPIRFVAAERGGGIRVRAAAM